MLCVCVYFLNYICLFIYLSFSASTGYSVIFEDVRCGKVANFLPLFWGRTAINPSGLCLWQCWQWSFIYYSKRWGKFWRKNSVTYSNGFAKLRILGENEGIKILKKARRVDSYLLYTVIQWSNNCGFVKNRSARTNSGFSHRFLCLAQTAVAVWD